MFLHSRLMRSFDHSCILYCGYYIINTSQIAIRPTALVFLTFSPLRQQKIQPPPPPVMSHVCCRPTLYNLAVGCVCLWCRSWSSDVGRRRCRLMTERSRPLSDHRQPTPTVRHCTHVRVYLYRLLSQSSVLLPAGIITQQRLNVISE